MTPDFTAKWYNAIVENCNLDPKTFQLIQGNITLNYTSEPLWNILDAIPIKSSNYLYNPVQSNLFSNNYGTIIKILKPSNPIVQEAIEVWNNAGGYTNTKAYSKTIKNIKQELDSAQTYTFKMNIASECLDPDTIVKFQKLTTFVAEPLSKQSKLNPELQGYKPWYNSAALQLAYHEKEAWLNPQDWNTYFGKQGSMLRCCVNLIVVDGVEISSNNERGLCPDFSSLIPNDTRQKLIKTTIKSSLGNPFILGVNVLTIPRYLGFSTIPPITDSSKVSEELEKILNSMDVSRKIVIAIGNNTENKLINPQYYLENGEIQRTHLTIYDQEVGFVASRKTEYLSFGTWGVVTYKIENTIKKLAIMWSVPFNYTFYENCFKLAIINADMQTDKNLLYDMYYNKGMTKGEVKKASTGSEIWEQEDYILQGIMGTGGSTTLKMSINMSATHIELI